MNLVLRPAKIEDAELLLSWRNDPETRARSFNSDPIELPAHVAWLSALLNNPSRQLFVAENNGVPVGTARADLDGSVSELSWTVAPQCRIRGIGKQMVSLLVTRTPGTVRAEIKPDNIASIKIANAAGLSLKHEKDGALHYWLHR